MGRLQAKHLIVIVAGVALASIAIPAAAQPSAGTGLGNDASHASDWRDGAHGWASVKDWWNNRKDKPPLEDQFVDTHKNSFTLGGKPYGVVGSNNYYPMYESEAMTDALFERAADSDFNTMRVWGFFAVGSPGGGDKPTVTDSDKGVYFEYWDDAAGAPAYNDGANGLEKLDYVVAKAKEEGLRLVLPLSNNWTAFGGIDQYNVWAGNDYHSDFYTDPQTRQWYKDWVDHLLNRVNTYTGVAYKDEPAIMAWELANEPRCIGDGGPADGSWGNGSFPRDPYCSADTLLPWVTEMSSYIKSVDSNHLVATGDEGFLDQSGADDWAYDGSDGVDSKAFAQVDSIDYLSFHLYPDHWGKDADWGTQWIKDHNNIAKQIKKPALMGEFGWTDKSTRNTVYKEWLDASLKTKGAGSLYWILSDDRDDGSLYPDYDGFTVYCPGPVCTTIGNYGKQLAHYGFGTFAPVADHDAVTVPFGESATVNLVANDISYSAKIKSSTVDLDASKRGVQRSVAVAGGTAWVDSRGLVTVVPDADYSGKVVVPYTVRDNWYRTSNTANLTVTVLPDPNASVVIDDFDADAEGWSCDGTGSVASVNGQGVFTNDTGDWAWCLNTLPAALDLSDKDSVTIDFVGTDSGVNPEFAFKVGSGWEWCQVAPISGTWNTPGEVTVDLSALTGSCADGLNDVHAIGMGMQAGVHTYDNLKAN
ncbi:cellulase family glycosylhydrolase [Demequina oxidasica]|uniref:cellulase family glycosylhydrolase n=1 Tax=Demequina oxidasica TaxID=676199 RepID=UPI0009FE14BE|nr:cellulase family glycosylhydrolase [Demequina oxidasica]